MFLRNLKIGTKLLALIVMTVLFITSVGATGYTYMSQMKNNSNVMYTERLQPIKWLGLIRYNVRAIDSYILEMIETKNPDVTKDLEAKTKDKLEQNTLLINNYHKTEIDSFEAGRLAQFDQDYQNYQKELLLVIQLVKEQKSTEAFTLFSTQLKPLRSQITAVTQELNDHNDKDADQLNETIHTSFSHAVKMMTTFIFFSVFLSLFVGFVIYRMITRPIQELKELILTAENGDFTVQGQYKSKDEIGLLTLSFNQMLHKLRSLIGQVTHTSEQVAASSQELTASAEQTSKATEHITFTIQEVAAGTDKQVQSIELASQSIIAMSAHMIQISSNSEVLSTTATQASEIALRGNESIKVSVRQMNSINQTVENLAEIVKGLGDRSNEIGQIIGVMTEIASQTNLLALNAAIEAARAGENGRGFAVVAGEVRKLAEQSTQSAQQIAELIAAIQTETIHAVDSMRMATHEVKEGITIVHTAGDSFEQIQRAINEVAIQIQEVSSAIKDMSVGSERIVGSIHSIVEVAEVAASGTQHVSASTEEQLASMEEISSSASHLSNMAEELQIQIGKFKV